MSTTHRVSANAKERAAFLEALERVKEHIAACEAASTPHIRGETTRQHLLAGAFALGDAMHIFLDARGRIDNAREYRNQRAG